MMDFLKVPVLQFLIIISILLTVSHGSELGLPNPKDIKVTSKGTEYTVPGTKGFKITTDLKMPKGGLAGIEKMDYIDPGLVDKIKLGDDRKYEANGELSCIAFGKQMLKKGLPALNSCMKEMQLTIGKMKKKLKDVLPCLVKCIGIKLEILNPDGLFNFDYAKRLLTEHVPKRFMEMIWQIWDTCVEFVKKLNPDDPKCKSYKPVIKCAVEAAFKVAAEAMKHCTDIPDVFKNTAKSYIKSKTQRKQLDEIIAVDHH